MTTSSVCPSSFVGLNSTTSVPAYRIGVWPGPTWYASPPSKTSSRSPERKASLPVMT